MPNETVETAASSNAEFHFRGNLYERNNRVISDIDTGISVILNDTDSTPTGTLSIDQSNNDGPAKLKMNLSLPKPKDGKDGRDGTDGKDGTDGDKGDKGDIGPIGPMGYSPKILINKNIAVLAAGSAPTVTDTFIGNDDGIYIGVTNTNIIQDPSAEQITIIKDKNNISVNNIITSTSNYRVLYEGRHYIYNGTKWEETNLNTKDMSLQFSFPPGPEGPQGPQGPMPIISIGTVALSNNYENASVSTSRTEEGYKLNFEIPQGRPPELEIGTITTLTYSDSATASWTYTELEPGQYDLSKVKLNLDIPQGIPGDFARIIEKDETSTNTVITDIDSIVGEDHRSYMQISRDGVPTAEINGVISIEQGGTGANTATAAIINLGIDNLIDKIIAIQTETPVSDYTKIWIRT